MTVKFHDISKRLHVIECDIHINSNAEQDPTTQVAGGEIV